MRRIAHDYERFDAPECLGAGTRSYLEAMAAMKNAEPAREDSVLT